MRRDRSIRFDRKIELAWLDAVAAYVAAGDDLPATRHKLFQLLEGQLSGGRTRGRACHKTVGILSGVWADVPKELESLRDRAAELHSLVDPQERLGLHWSLLLAGYPFFGGLVENAGRLLQLQGTLNLGQLNRRMRETLGERSTLDRATQRVIRSLVDWGVLMDGNKRGSYAASANKLVIGSEVVPILVEGLLRYTRKGLAREEILQHPALFPFQFRLDLRKVRSSSQFSISRQGLDSDYVALV